MRSSTTTVWASVVAAGDGVIEENRYDVGHAGLVTVNVASSREVTPEATTSAEMVCAPELSVQVLTGFAAVSLPPARSHGGLISTWVAGRLRARSSTRKLTCVIPVVAGTNT